MEREGLRRVNRLARGVVEMACGGRLARGAIEKACGGHTARDE